jgi:hypothetical protein
MMRLVVGGAVAHGIIQGEQVHAGLLCLCLTCSWGPMQRVVPYLLIAARVLAILAVLAGLAGGLLRAVVGSFFICIDGCSSRDAYFSALASPDPGPAPSMSLCVVLAALALAVFLVYCLATRQPWRAVIVLLFFLVGGLLGVAALNALLQHAQATLPVDDFGFLIKDSAAAWERQWGLSLTLVAVVWSGGLACLQWGHRWGRAVSSTVGHAEKKTAG